MSPCDWTCAKRGRSDSVFAAGAADRRPSATACPRQRCLTDEALDDRRSGRSRAGGARIEQAATLARCVARICPDSAVIDERTAWHVHGVQHRLRRGVGRDPRPRAPPAGRADLAGTSAGLRRVVDGLDVGHHCPGRVSTAQAAHACRGDNAPQRLDGTRGARPRRRRSPLRVGQAGCPNVAGRSGEAAPDVYWLIAVAGLDAPVRPRGARVETQEHGGTSTWFARQIRASHPVRLRSRMPGIMLVAEVKSALRVHRDFGGRGSVVHRITLSERRLRRIGHVYSI